MPNVTSPSIIEKDSLPQYITLDSGSGSGSRSCVPSRNFIANPKDGSRYVTVIVDLKRNIMMTRLRIFVQLLQGTHRKFCLYKQACQ